MDDMQSEHLERYMQALENAAEAIEAARRLRPHAGLDHAMERLRWMMLDAGRELISAPPSPPPS